MSHYSDFSTLAYPQERDACGIGFIADKNGQKSHEILQDAINALRNLAHRGAVSADGLTGDGAGLLTQLPHKFFRHILNRKDIKLNNDRDLAVGVFFIEYKDEENTSKILEAINEVVKEVFHILLWRDIPINELALGSIAHRRLPILKQLFVERPSGFSDDEFERRLYLKRKRIENRMRELGLGNVYVPSFSHRTIVYKGLMLGEQIDEFYLDLAQSEYETAIALFHQRYSTNTFPSWSLAQPFRFLAHNGEINTLQGNVNFMRSREPVLESDLWGKDVKDLLPIIQPGGSDSAAIDNAFELLMLSGRDPLHTVMMLVPEAYEGNEELSPEVKSFYEYHSCLIEPWDGPAALVFSDGRFAVASLDRNGLRPQRYLITKSGKVIIGSETGIVNVPEEDIVERGRLGPGKILAVDTLEKRFMHNDEIKAEYARRKPYDKWVKSSKTRAKADYKHPDYEVSSRGWDADTIIRYQNVFGYSKEDYSRIFEPMVLEAKVPVGSMGDDTPLAMLSQYPQQLYRYFKQRFAQVTNPPIDPLREDLVMSLRTIVGPRESILNEEEDAAYVIGFKSFILDEAEFAYLREEKTKLRTRTLAATFSLSQGLAGLQNALDALCDAAVRAVRNRASIIILSDREIDSKSAPIPMLLATAAVHHYLLREGLRTKAAIVCDTGEPREDHHFACLIGYGAALIHPYLALATARNAAMQAKEGDISSEQATQNYKKAVEKGLLKIMSKMGISTVSSYRAAQVFEVIGLSQEVVDKYFVGTPNAIGGVTLEGIAQDVLAFHADGFGEDPKLKDLGIYRFRKAGEYHAFNPQVFKSLHKAVRTESFEVFKDYIKAVDSRPASNLRDLLDYSQARKPVPLEEVEPVEDVVRRFTTQAMSHGSVSRETHETIAVAMNRLGAKSNSGEGGEASERFHRYVKDKPPEEYGYGTWAPKANDWGNSAIKQVASGRFGVTPAYLMSASEIEIKMAQGAKPGEGGQLPGHKVNDEIAQVRRSVPGVTLISPPPHHDIYSIEDLAQLIYDLKRINREARVCVKLVATDGVGTVAAGVAKGYADNIQISGHDGGTGASPLSSIKHAGLPWEIGLAETQQVLVDNDLRGRIRLRVDGGLKTGRDVIVAALLGAEEYGFGTAALVAAGCAMIRQCHLNTCPVGVATQRPDLRAKYVGKPEHVVNFMFYVAQQVRMILAEMGYRKLDSIVGRVDLLKIKKDIVYPKDTKLDLSIILRETDPAESKAHLCAIPRNDRLETLPLLDDQIAQDAKVALEEGTSFAKSYQITNKERSVGARLSGEIARLYGEEGLPEGIVELNFTGSSGQSFGVWNNCGVRLILNGDAQDYVGKGMYGGEIIIRPRQESKLLPQNNVIIGNTVMYGATGGSLYASGQAGERLCVRNSGGFAVVEGCGDHGCEYMTGGVAVILGKTGRNFGAGMSGGIAYVLDEEKQFEKRYNPGMVGLELVEHDIDEQLLKCMIERHAQVTCSPLAKNLLSDWENVLTKFWKVAPHPSVEDATAEEQDVKVLELKALETIRAQVEASQVAEAAA